MTADTGRIGSADRAGHEPSQSSLSRPDGDHPSRKAELLLQRIVDATHSHIDGRDLLAEIHPRKTLDIKRRVDGVETWFEGDWLSTVWDAVKEAKAYLYSREKERAASESARNCAGAERVSPKPMRATFVGGEQ